MVPFVGSLLELRVFSHESNLIFKGVIDFILVIMLPELNVSDLKLCPCLVIHLQEKKSNLSIFVYDTK